MHQEDASIKKSKVMCRISEYVTRNSDKSCMEKGTWQEYKQQLDNKR